MEKLAKVLKALENALKSDDDLATKVNGLMTELEFTAEHQAEVQKVLSIVESVKDNAPKVLEAAGALLAMFEAKGHALSHEDVTKEEKPSAE